MSNFVIAKYIRLSIDDVKTDSLSIENQRKILDNHIDKLDISNTEILEFVDNGFSGTNFERPAVQELLELVRQSKINMILVKDFSRYGRNAIETGYFIERVFPLYGVRFIAVSDNYDSDNLKETTGGMEVAFKFLMHEYYSQDLSKKQKSALQAKFKTGEFQSKYCLYGYKKGESGRLVPDENTWVVRLIFESALTMNVTEIIRLLYAKKIPTSKGNKFWDRSVILRILEDERYIGTYIMGKNEVRVIGTNKQRRKPESEWIKIPNHHEAIISNEVFEKVRTKFMHFTQTKSPRDYLLRGKVRCGVCGHAMNFQQQKTPNFICNSTIADENSECYKMRINEFQIENILFEVVSKQAKIILNSDLSEDCSVQTDEQIEYQKLIDNIQSEKVFLYEKYVLGEIDVQNYLSVIAD